MGGPNWCIGSPSRLTKSAKESPCFSMPMRLAPTPTRLSGLAPPGRPRPPMRYSQCTVTPSDDPDALFGLSAMVSAAPEVLFDLDEHALVGRTQGKVRSTNLRASSSRKTQIHAGRAVPARHTSAREAKRPRHRFQDRDLRHCLGRLEAPLPCGPALALG